MKNSKKVISICTIVILFCLIMAVVDGILKSSYVVKSAIKLGLFLGFPLLYAFLDKGLQIKSIFILRKKDLGFSFGLGICVFVVILGGYLILKDVFDFSAITDALGRGAGVNRDNFVFVSLYISFVNSLLEEFFFRGFAFLTLKKITTAKFAHIFSATAFALYHIAMMTGWFSLPVFLIVMAGLFAGGLIFNYLNDKTKNIYPSWIVHMFANFAINTVGFILFGII